MKKENKTYKVKGEARIFPMENPWIYLPVPKTLTDKLKFPGGRGLIPITVTCGSSTWDTSLLPYGNGTKFIPLKASVRKKEDIYVEDVINLAFTLRSSFKK